MAPQWAEEVVAGHDDLCILLCRQGIRAENVNNMANNPELSRSRPVERENILASVSPDLGSWERIESRLTIWGRCPGDVVDFMAAA